MDIYGVINCFLLKVTKGKSLKSSFVVNAKTEDLETLKVQIRAEGFELVWDELSPIVADRSEIIDTFFAAILPEQGPKHGREYCIEEVVVELIERKTIKENKLPELMRTAVQKWRSGVVKDTQSVVESQDMFSESEESMSLAQRRAQRKKLKSLDNGLAATATKGDVDQVTEKMTSVANGVEKIWDNTECLIKKMQVLSLAPNKINAALGNIETKVDQVPDKLNQFNAALGNIETKMDQVPDKLNQALNGIDKTWINTDAILRELEAMKVRMEELRDGQRNLEQKLQVEGLRPKGLERKNLCAFCESDSHSFKQCAKKKCCIICGRNNHPVKRCSFNVELNCRVCNTVGHAALLHETEDLEFRIEIMSYYGPANFRHFMANKKHEDQQVFSWEEKPEQAGPSRQSWGGNRRSSGPYQKKGRRST